MYLSLIFLPFISSFFSGFFGRYLGVTGASFVSTSCVFSSFLLSLVVFYEVGLEGTPCYCSLSSWFNSCLFIADWGFLFDSLSSLMLVIVTFISFLVHLYSIEYMANDPHLPRFMSYLSLFTFFMLILVSADNFIQLFLGWEGVGLCSYLLINFWFTRIQANKAAIKAMIINRIGDFGLALGIFLICVYCGSLEYTNVFATISNFKSLVIYKDLFTIDLIFLISILLFIGAVGKSAQLGLHTWLPDAMEGPTPVSALIHAATMVTAGVFLLARCSPIFELAPNALIIVVLLGSATSFFAATTGLLQNDIKKVIAYSTCSQLGYMVFGCGLSNYSAGIFHLANHAFFKALLFLGAGAVIHAVADEQDMRRMGGLRRLIPFTFSIMLIGSFALMGFPFLSGFYSKDLILESAFLFKKVDSFFSLAYFLGTLSAFFTAFYSMRLLFLVFLSRTNAYKTIIANAHEPALKMSTPLFLLSIPSIFSGYFFSDLFTGLGSNYWLNSIFVEVGNIVSVDAEFIRYPAFKVLPVILSLFGLHLSFFLYKYFSKYLYKLKKIHIGLTLYTFLNRKWFFDKVYNDFIGSKILNAGYKYTYNIVDRGVLEILGPFGLSYSFLSVSKWLLKRDFSGSFFVDFRKMTVYLICLPLLLFFPTGWLIFKQYAFLSSLVLIFSFLSFSGISHSQKRSYNIIKVFYVYFKSSFLFYIQSFFFWLRDYKIFEGFFRFVIYARRRMVLVFKRIYTYFL